jgi:hypothetical protein
MCVYVCVCVCVRVYVCHGRLDKADDEVVSRNKTREGAPQILNSHHGLRLGGLVDGNNGLHDDPTSAESA